MLTVYVQRKFKVSVHCFVFINKMTVGKPT